MADRSDPRIPRALLLGLGLDNTDGHKRFTRGKDFFLLGGSRDTHERMQEKAIRFTEELERRGKDMSEISRDELRDIAREIDLGKHD